MRSEIFRDNPNLINKVKALTMVGLLGLGATACGNLEGTGRGNAIKVCNGYSSDVLATWPGDPHYHFYTDPERLQRFTREAAPGLGIRDHSAADLWNDDKLDKLGEIVCMSDLLSDTHGAAVLTFDGERLSAACQDEGTPEYINHPIKNPAC